MPLVKDGAIVEDSFVRLAEDDAIPASGGVIVDLERFQAEKARLFGREGDLGVRLEPGQAPELIRDDLPKLALIALAFPEFGDGRAYSYARLLRERYGFEGEIRAVGDILCEQLHYMARSGFDAFEVESEKAASEWKVAIEEITSWYQPTGDGRTTIDELRQER